MSTHYTQEWDRKMARGYPDQVSTDSRGEAYFQYVEGAAIEDCTLPEVPDTSLPQGV